MSWNEAQDAIFRFLAAGGVGWFAYEIHQMRSSMEKLNINMAELIQVTTFHGKQIDRHEDRLEELERKV